jgi:hypothetical protein
MSDLGGGGVMIKPLFDAESHSEWTRLASEGWLMGSRMNFEKLR